MTKRIIKSAFIAFLSVSLAGCTVIFQRGRRSDQRKIEELSQQLDELMQAKKLLEERLSGEIQDQQVKLQMMDKGLVITVVGDLLFDSGKANIRPEASGVMDKVGRILKENVADYNVGIEGHTDNQPIQASGWKSNWELSSARALSVLHYLVNDKGIEPRRLSAIGYGEYRPVSSNDTKAGKQMNRRVEIVIMPKITKVKEGKEGPKEPTENLK
ncbi:MAG TPA: OmpA family protein [Candidatus Margulisiibacteriota bacterium]|nr:OmpA family protein [Candidatus Margulisiibacteriota bacterium]